MLARLFEHFDQISFWLGFFTGIFFLWGYNSLRPALKQARQTARQKTATALETRRLGVEYFYRNDVIRYVQSLHLASPLFSLDEIITTPQVLAPPPPTHPGGDAPPANVLSRIIPYMPDYPEFASMYGAEQFTLARALSRGANLALFGPVGSGKSVALAHLAMQVAQLSPEAGPLANFVPFYIHAADLSLPLPENTNALAHLTNHLWNAGYLSRRTIGQLPQLVRTAFDEKRVLLLMDGVDELSSAGVEQVVDFLAGLLAQHSHVRVAAAVSAEYYDGMTALGLAPVVMAGWDRYQRMAFIQRWGDLWTRHIEKTVWREENAGLEAGMLNHWLQNETTAFTPLELTLKVWAAYAGDILGPENRHAFDAFLRRRASDIPAAQTALERVGMQMALAQDPIPHARAAGNWAIGNLKTYTEEELIALETQEAAEDRVTQADERIAGRVHRGTVSTLVENGMLVNRPNGHISFMHPVFAGYYGGRGLATFGGAGTLMSQVNWSARTHALHYLASETDISGLLQSFESGDPIQQTLLSSGRWLRDTPAKSNSRLNVMRKMAALLQNAALPLAIRTRAMAALSASGDAGIGALCARLLTYAEADIRRLAVLGLGLVRDQKYLKEIGDALGDGDFGVRAAACFALANFGTSQAIETVATALLQLDEETQRAAAEALANHPDDGHELLKEAVAVDDLLVRRAAVFGLEKIETPEAVGLIRQRQLGDEQWIVRNAATQVMGKIEEGSAAIPAPYPPLHEIPWLIALAGEGGEGISPGRSSNEMLLRALRTGNEEQKLAALDLYLRSAEDSVVPIIEDYTKHPATDIQLAAINTLWHMRAAGIARASGVAG